MTRGPRAPVTRPKVWLFWTPVAGSNCVPVSRPEYWVWLKALNISVRNWMKRPSFISGMRLPIAISQLFIPGLRQTLTPALPKFAIVTLGLPHCPMTGAETIPVLNQDMKVFCPSQLPTILARAPSVEPVTSVEVVQPRPGVNGEPLPTLHMPLRFQLSKTHFAGRTFILVPTFGRP